jgi:hypothetical protein
VPVQPTCIWVVNVPVVAQRTPSTRRRCRRHLWAKPWLYLAHVQDAVDDLHKLARNSANVDHKKWPRPVVHLYLGAINPETFSVASLSNMDAKVDPESACEAAFYLGTFYLEKCDRKEAQAPLRGGCQRLSAKSHRVGSRKDGIDAASVDSLTQDGCRRYERPNPAPTSDDHELGKCLITRRARIAYFNEPGRTSRPPTAHAAEVIQSDSIRIIRVRFTTLLRHAFGRPRPGVSLG